MSEELIEKYADLTERLNMLTSNYTELREKAITEEVRKALRELEDEYIPMIDAVREELTTVKGLVEQTVLEQGSTLKGSRFMATWNKGRETWDGKALDGFAMAHPEILAAKKVGEPTVSFRQVK